MNSADSCGCGDIDESASIRVAVITLSDTRTAATDRSGDEVVSQLKKSGHQCVQRQILNDDADPLRQQLQSLVANENVQAIITTGGTGIAPRDMAVDAVESLLDITLPGFGEHFRRVSVDEIGPKAILSRAIAGRINRTIVIALPGSTGAVRTGMTKCVLPILPHMVSLASR